MCWASTRRICRPARRPARPIVLSAGRDRRRAEDAGMGGRAHAASRPRPSAGSRSSSPRPNRPRCSAAMRPAARATASSSTAPPMRWRRSPAMSASPAAIRASATAPPAASGIKSLPTGNNPIDAKVSTPLLADLLARGKAGGYPADIKMIYSAGGDLFNQCPNANKIVGVARRRRVHRRAGPFPDADRAPCRHRAAGDDLLGAQRRAHAVGRRAGTTRSTCSRRSQPMYECRNDIDIFADLARARRHRRLQRQERERVAARADRRRRRRFRRLRRSSGVARFPPPRGRGRVRRANPRSGQAQVHDAVGQDRGLFDGAGRQARPLRPRASFPPIPTWIAPASPTPQLSADAVHAQIAGAHPLDPRQPAAASRASIPTMSGCIPTTRRRAASPMARRVRVFNECGATVLPAKVTDRIARGVVSIKEGAWSCARRRAAPTPAAAPTC